MFKRLCFCSVLVLFFLGIADICFGEKLQRIVLYPQKVTVGGGRPLALVCGACLDRGLAPPQRHDTISSFNQPGKIVIERQILEGENWKTLEKRTLQQELEAEKRWIQIQGSGTAAGILFIPVNRNPKERYVIHVQKLVVSAVDRGQLAWNMPPSLDQLVEKRTELLGNAKNGSLRYIISNIVCQRVVWELAQKNENALEWIDNFLSGVDRKLNSINDNRIRSLAISRFEEVRAPSIHSVDLVIWEALFFRSFPKTPDSTGFFQYSHRIINNDGIPLLLINELIARSYLFHHWNQTGIQPAKWKEHWRLIEPPQKLDDFRNYRGKNVVFKSSSKPMQHWQQHGQQKIRRCEIKVIKESFKNTSHGKTAALILDSLPSPPPAGKRADKECVFVFAHYTPETIDLLKNQFQELKSEHIVIIMCGGEQSQFKGIADLRKLALENRKTISVVHPASAVSIRAATHTLIVLNQHPFLLQANTPLDTLRLCASLAADKLRAALESKDPADALRREFAPDVIKFYYDNNNNFSRERAEEILEELEVFSDMFFLFVMRGTTTTEIKMASRGGDYVSMFCAGCHGNVFRVTSKRFDPEGAVWLM